MKPSLAPAERALREVSREARELGARELDWDRVEARLFAKLEQAPQAVSSTRSRSSLPFLLGAAAALAAAAFAIALWPVTPAAPVAQSPLPTATVQTATNGDTLDAAQILQAEATPLAVEHDGRAHWTLAPHGRARVLSHDGVIRIALERGSLRAQVVPTHEVERFVVEAAGTRVAVHGTVFSVALTPERTVVDVEQGVVAVRALSEPYGEPDLLRARAHAEYGLDGSASGVSERATSPEHAPATATARKVVLPESTGTAAPSAAPTQPGELTIGAAEAGFAPIFDAVRGCFSEHTAALGNVRVTVRSELTLGIAPDGHVTHAEFSPPLSPAVQSCAHAAALNAKFSASTDGATLKRVIELSR